MKNGFATADHFHQKISPRLRIVRRLCQEHAFARAGNFRSTLNT